MFRPLAGFLALTIACAPAPSPAPPVAVDTDPPAPAQPAPTPAAPPVPTLEITAPGAPATAHIVKAEDGHEITVWSKRPADAKGVFILVHGRTWSGIPDFDLQVPGESLSLMDNLVAQGFAAYAVDLRGYGATSRDQTGWNDPSKAASDTVEAMRFAYQREGFSPVVLGWSFGAIHAHIAVQREPEIARALVLYGNPRGPNGRSAVEPDPAAPQRARNTKNAARSDFITRGTISEEAIQAYVDACHAADPVRADWYRLHLFDEAEASKIAVPTLSIRGDGDPVASAKTQKRFIAALKVPGAYVEIDNADHAAHLEHPEVFLREVLAFVEEHAPAK